MSFIAVIHDRTTKCVLESQLAEAQKMESVGQPAVGIAHEITIEIPLTPKTTEVQDACEETSSIC